MGVVIDSVNKTLGDFSLSLDLQAREGELLTLLGPSGCGKTSTLRIISGFLPPDSGRIVLQGQDVTSLSPEARDIGLVFQNYALFPHMDVFKNISYGPRMKKWERGRIRERVYELLELVYLSGHERKRIQQLSGGEQQRVALARALASGPRLLLLDEPLSALDARLRKVLRKEIRKIQQELKLTTIYVTHDQEEALAISDRIALMNRGRVEQVGKPEELYEHPRTLFSASFIGSSNSLEAVVETKLPAGNYRIRTSLGPLIVASPLDFQNGEECILFFRPEHIRFLEQGQDQAPLPGEFNARVLSQEYYGNFYLTEIQAGGSLLLATLFLERKMESRGSGRFRLDLNKCLLFKK